MGTAYSYKVGYSSVIGVRHSVCPSVSPSGFFVTVIDSHVTSHMGAPTRGEKLIRFWASSGATFDFKMATKIWRCLYLRDL